MSVLLYPATAIIVEMADAPMVAATIGSGELWVAFVAWLVVAAAMTLHVIQTVFMRSR